MGPICSLKAFDPYKMSDSASMLYSEQKVCTSDYMAYSSFSPKAELKVQPTSIIMTGIRELHNSLAYIY